MGRTFPHRLPAADLDWFDRFQTPVRDEALVDFAMGAVRKEHLGRDNVPDLLGVSFCATDLSGTSTAPTATRSWT